LKPSGVFIKRGLRLGLLCFNVTFNNISVKLWGSVSLVEETGVTGEYYQTNKYKKHQMVSNTLLQ
jgi:hypothetical protein